MFKTPSHSYYVVLTVRGIRNEGRAASISEACRCATTVLSQHRKVTPDILSIADRLVRDMIHMRRTNQRGALRTKIAETAASIELTMDAAPKGWALKGGPKEHTNWDSVRRNFGVARWK